MIAYTKRGLLLLFAALVIATSSAADDSVTVKRVYYSIVGNTPVSGAMIAPARPDTAAPIAKVAV